MSENKFPYVTRLDVLHRHLERVDVPALAKACKDKWYNQTLCRVNDSVLRLGIVRGQYHWHKHDDDDELFFVLSGKLLVDIEGGGSFELQRQQGFVVPRGVVHRTRAPRRTVMLMVENAGIVPTGDA